MRPFAWFVMFAVCGLPSDLRAQEPGPRNRRVLDALEGQHPERENMSLLTLETDETLTERVLGNASDAPRPITRATLDFTESMPSRIRLARVVTHLNAFPHLHTITLRGLPPGTKVWQDLARLPRIRKIHIIHHPQPEAPIPERDPENPDAPPPPFDALQAAVPAALEQTGLAGLRHLRGVEEITLSSNAFTLEVIRSLEHLPKLRSLKVTVDPLQHWRQPSQPIPTDVVRAIGRLTTVRELNLPTIADQNALREVSKLQHLKAISIVVQPYEQQMPFFVREGYEVLPLPTELGGKRSLSPDEVVRAVCAIEELEELRVEGAVREASIPDIKRLTKLHTLKMNGCLWSYDAAQNLRKALKMPEWFAAPDPGRGFVVVRDLGVGIDEAVDAVRAVRGTDQLSRLMCERYAAAIVMTKARLAEFKQGKGTQDVLLESVVELTRAADEILEDPAAREASLVRRVEFLRSAEDLNKARFDAARINVQDLHQSIYYRTQGEIDLLRFRQQHAADLKK